MDLENLLVNGETLAAVTTALNTKINTAQTTADNAATAAAAAQTTADNAATTAASKQNQLYMHNIKIIDDSFTLKIVVILQEANAITTESAVTQTILDKALAVSVNDGNIYSIQFNSITRSGTDVSLAGTFINNSGLTTQTANVDLSISTFTDSVVAL